MAETQGDAFRAWQLLVRFFFAQRDYLVGSSGEAELPPIQCHVLHLLEPGRPVPMGRLAETLACHASNVTGLVDRLEARGLVERRLSEDDRRIKVLKLTSEARPLTRLSPRQQHALVRILEVLVDESPGACVREPAREPRF